MSEQVSGGQTPAEELDEDLPELNQDPDHEPDDSSEYVAVETQDPEADEPPEVNKHQED